MQPQLLLDTHILLRWLAETKKLSRAQLRAIESAVQKGQPLAISAMSLLEVALLAGGPRPTIEGSLHEFLHSLDSNPVLRILPITCEIAEEVASLAVLRDPADRAIVATARVHRLRLVTSDERIVDSNLVPVIE